MEIFLDTADLKEIRAWMDHGVLDGVTTNPSILLKDGGVDMQGRAREIAELIAPRPLSVEVTTNDPEEMITQGRKIARWAKNIAVKIPIINENGAPCLKAVRTLTDDGTRVNVTACLSFGQVALAAKAGATYASIFAGRIGDEGGDAVEVIAQSAEWLARWKSPTKIIVGSIRAAINVQEAALAGAHVLTVPPSLLGKWIDHQYSRATVRQFNADAAKALEVLRRSSKAAAPA